MIDQGQFKSGMRRLAAGVSVITAAEGGLNYGLVATSVSSLSIEPPTLLISVNQASSAHDPIAASRAFCVNLLRDDDLDIARRFSAPGERHRRFEGERWSRRASGAPVLIGALASFDCRVVGCVPYGTHSVFFGAIDSLELGDGGVAPLIYLDGLYRSLAEAAE